MQARWKRVSNSSTHPAKRVGRTDTGFAFGGRLRARGLGCMHASSPSSLRKKRSLVFQTEAALCHVKCRTMTAAAEREADEAVAWVQVVVARRRTRRSNIFILHCTSKEALEEAEGEGLAMGWDVCSADAGSVLVCPFIPQELRAALLTS